MGKPAYNWPSGSDVCADLKSQGRPIVLSFSAGKDSLALWLRLREFGVECRPVYKYLVPGLSFVEASIDYYERAFGVQIKQLPHDSLSRWLVNMTFQAPENCLLIEESNVTIQSRVASREAAVRAVGLPADSWTAVGTRACDNPYRRMAFAKTGPWNRKDLSVAPIWDMNKAGVIAIIAASGIKLPSEYRIFGRSFDGLDFRFLAGVKKHWPRDYEKILEWFPLADLELFRHEIALKHRKPDHSGRSNGIAISRA